MTRWPRLGGACVTSHQAAASCLHCPTGARTDRMNDVTAVLKNIRARLHEAHTLAR
jgi:hypothetical protein